MDFDGVRKYISILLFTLLAFQGVEIAISNKKENCFRVVFTKTSWIDSRPEYCVNMTFNDGGSIRTVWNVNRVVRLPISRFALVSFKKRGRDERTVYNITARLCEIQSVLEKVSMLKAAARNAFKLSNYTLSCPLEPGIYVSNGYYISSRNPILLLAYQQKSLFLAQGGLSEELPDGIVKQLTAYSTEFKVVRTRCEKE